MMNGIFQTGDDTYMGFAFTPAAPGASMVEVVVARDPVTGVETEEAIVNALDLTSALFMAVEEMHT